MTAVGFRSTGRSWSRGERGYDVPDCFPLLCRAAERAAGGRWAEVILQRRSQHWIPFCRNTPSGRNEGSGKGFAAGEAERQTLVPPRSNHFDLCI
eukprot:gene17522-biopygen814